MFNHCLGQWDCELGRVFMSMCTFFHGVYIHKWVATSLERLASCSEEYTESLNAIRNHLMP